MFSPRKQQQQQQKFKKKIKKCLDLSPSPFSVRRKKAQGIVDALEGKLLTPGRDNFNPSDGTLLILGSDNY